MKSKGLPAEAREEVWRLWSETHATAREIGQRFGVSGNAIIGYAHRGGWPSFNPPAWSRAALEAPIPTLFDRMDALEQNLDRVLAETEGVGRIAIAVSERGRKAWEGRKNPWPHL